MYLDPAAKLDIKEAFKSQAQRIFLFRPSKLKPPRRCNERPSHPRIFSKEEILLLNLQRLGKPKPPDEAA